MEIAQTEREPVMWPTIVRRVVPGAIQTMERRVDDQRALCVFWSVEHAEQGMREAGYSVEEGWKAIERDHEELARVFDLLAMISGPQLMVLEPSPDDPDLGGVFEPAEFIAMLERSLEDS